MEELLGSTEMDAAFLLPIIKNFLSGIAIMMNEPTSKIKETRLYAEWDYQMKKNIIRLETISAKERTLIIQKPAYSP